VKKILYFTKKFFILILNIKYYLKVKIIFRNPEKKEVIIFNSFQLNFYEFIFKKDSYFCIDVFDLPHRKMEKIYISFPLLKLILIEIYKGNIKLCYYLALIKIIQPKLVFTWIDNDIRFSKMAKILENKVKFCAIQNAMRSLEDVNKTIASNLYIPNYLCFGNNVIDFFKNMKINVKHFHIVGSLRLSNAEKYIKKNNLINLQPNYDLCLISENLPSSSDEFKKERFEALEKLAKNVEKLSIKYKLKTVLALKRFKNHELYQSEINFYKKVLNKNTPIIIKDRVNEFTSYELAYNSRLTIGCRSTLLVEIFAKGGRALSCNYIEGQQASKKFDTFDQTFLPNLPEQINYNNFFYIKDSTYNAFEKRVLFLLDINQQYFDKYTNRIRNYMISYDKKYSAEEKIKNKINQLLE
jgi:surface carbohydrate biosynthesis protein